MKVGVDRRLAAPELRERFLQHLPLALARHVELLLMLPNALSESIKGERGRRSKEKKKLEEKDDDDDDDDKDQP